jgi:hypothetical protein
MRYKYLSLVLAYRLTTTHTQHFICYICHLAQPGRKSSRIKVENVLGNCLLFSCSKLLLAVASFKDVCDSVVSASQCRMWYVEHLSSASEASKLTCSIGRKGKLDSALSIKWLRVFLLRHVTLMREWVVLAKTDQRDGLTRVTVEYVKSRILGYNNVVRT